MTKKIVQVTNIPSPYQIEWAKSLRNEFEVEFWFMASIKKSNTGRPDYWEIDMPPYCRRLPAWFEKGEVCYGPTLSRELSNYNPDIVVLGGAWHMVSFYQAYRWAIKNDKKIIISSTEFSEDMNSLLKTIRNKILYRCVYRRVNLYFANAYIHYDYYVNVLKVKNIHLFMNYDNYKPYMEHDLRNGGKEIVFMYGGSISRRLRVPETIKVFEKIAQKYSNARLVIGGYGPEKNECKKIVASSKSLQKTVGFHDVESWEEIPQVYRKCDILLNYANYSPGSGVILSALASGMGLISSIAVHASRHFLIDKYNGYFVRDENELYLAMENYMAHPNLVSVHSVRSREIAQCTLTFDEHIKDFKKAIKSLFPEIQK